MIRSNFNRTATTPRRRELQWGIAWLAVLTILIVILRPQREQLDPGTTALILLIAPLIATGASLRMALIASITSALAFNFIFTEPYDSFVIASTTSVAAFFIYLLISVTMAVMVTRLRDNSAASDERAAQALLLRDLTIDLVRQNVWLQPPLSTALADLVTSLQLHGASMSINVPDSESFSIDAGRHQRSRDAMQTLLTQMQGVQPSPQLPLASLRGDNNIRAFPIATGNAFFGLLAIEPEPGAAITVGKERIINLYANVVALACERASYMKQAVERKALEETDRLRVVLMQSVAHDLRTPLASITALASAMPQLGTLDPEQRQVFEDIEQQAHRLARLVDQVLDLSRIEGGALKVTLQTVAVDELVYEAVQSLASGAPAVAISLPDGLPPVSVDEPLMKQVIVNVLENAIKYGEPPFELTARVRESRLQILIMDHGKGIPEAERHRLFDPNFAMHRSSTDERSRGLGLAISAGFVAAHRGHIRIEPTPGGGSTFVISLPLPPTGNQP